MKTRNNAGYRNDASVRYEYQCEYTVIYNKKERTSVEQAYKASKIALQLRCFFQHNKREGVLFGSFNLLRPIFNSIALLFSRFKRLDAKTLA